MVKVDREWDQQNSSSSSIVVVTVVVVVVEQVPPVYLISSGRFLISLTSQHLCQINPYPLNLLLDRSTIYPIQSADQKIRSGFNKIFAVLYISLCISGNLLYEDYIFFSVAPKVQVLAKRNLKLRTELIILVQNLIFSIQIYLDS